MNLPVGAVAGNRQTEVFRSAFEQARGWEEFLARHGSSVDRTKWLAVMDQVRLSEDQLAVLAGFTRRMPVLCMAGVWCGDCCRQCPIMVRIAAGSPWIDLRFVDRDENPELAAELQVCGAARVPQAVWMSEDHEPVLRAGDKTLSQWRELRDRRAGAVCSTGLVSANDARTERIVVEWFEWFELAQLILQNSPRLQQRHGGW